MRVLGHLFANNRAWAAEITRREPDFFERLAGQQAPEFLWIGCADSRVPANEIVGLLPGELFVHRNVANVVVHTDLNCLSVHPVRGRRAAACGTSSSAGTTAAAACWRRCATSALGLIDNWLRHVQDVARSTHAPSSRALPDEAARHARLCELNVIEQVINVCQTTIVQDAWRAASR